MTEGTGASDSKKKEQEKFSTAQVVNVIGGIHERNRRVIQRRYRNQMYTLSDWTKILKKDRLIND